ncbi:transposable element Tc3 transposase [Trichonephila clavipes]|nr:transposable element Tc3 transposase [Trichonephila clavipes]
MVWAGIMINGPTRLHVVANGTMTDDNATCHRTLAVQDCLDSEGIQRLVWPARSPDLNPIENVWDALGRQVAGRNYPPTNKNTLIRALTEEWDNLPQQLLDNVVQMKKKKKSDVKSVNRDRLRNRNFSERRETAIFGAFGEFLGHMAREVSLHPISDNLMWNDSDHFMLVSSSQLIGRANRWGNCLGLADFCDHGGDEMMLS